MIGSLDFERAEKTLSIVYGGDLGRQLESLQVDRETLDNVLAHCNSVLDRRYASARRASDPRLEAAYNTMMLHLFLVGVIVGRNSNRGIE